MNVNFRQQRHRITVSKIVSLCHWRRLHWALVHWYNGICQCSMSEHRVWCFCLPDYWAGKFIYLFVCLFFWSMIQKRVQTSSAERVIFRYIPKITWRGMDLLPTLSSVLKSTPQSILCPYNLPHCCSFSSYVFLYRMSVQLWHDEFDLKCIYAMP